MILHPAGPAASRCGGPGCCWGEARRQDGGEPHLERQTEERRTGARERERRCRRTHHAELIAARQLEQQSMRRNFNNNDSPPGAPLWLDILNGAFAILG